MEDAGFYEDATEYYYQSLLKKSDFIEARQGLNRTGEQVLSDKLSDFTQKNQNGNKKEAVYAFLDAKAFKEKLAGVNVKLAIPSQYKSDFEFLKSNYLDEQYKAGLTYLDADNFDKAEAVFNEIEQINPNYKDIKDLKKIAYIEPFYRTGKSNLENGNYRSSYAQFTEVISVDPNYKDAVELKNEALKKGLITIGVINFENGTPIPNANKKVEAFVMDALNNSNDPFLKVIDRSNYAQIIEEQKLNLSGIVDESTAAEIGQLLGVKFLLGGTLLELTKRTGKTSKLKKTGFKAVQIKKHNSETDEDYYETQYKRTYYYEYKQVNSAYASVQLKIISLTSGEILVSKIIEKEIKDEVHYCTYEGKYNNLYPSVDGQLDSDSNHKRYLKNLLKARHDIHSVEFLSNDALKFVAKTVKSEVETFSYAYVK